MKQRPCTKKEDASAPTVAIKSVMMACGMDAFEGSDVATVDIPGAFMHADVDETAHVRLEGTMTELFVKSDPKLHRKCTVMEHGKAVMHVELAKALCGTLRAALLFWKPLTKKLVADGF